jgi:hemin uptake protein HemP
MDGIKSSATELVMGSGTSSSSPAAVLETRCLQSRELFQSAREIVIEHAGCHYRLRITQHGKLILTK